MKKTVLTALLVTLAISATVDAGAWGGSSSGGGPIDWDYSEDGTAISYSGPPLPTTDDPSSPPAVEAPPPVVVVEAPPNVEAPPPVVVVDAPPTVEAPPPVVIIEAPPTADAPPPSVVVEAPPTVDPTNPPTPPADPLCEYYRQYYCAYAVSTTNSNCAADYTNSFNSGAWGGAYCAGAICCQSIRDTVPYCGYNYISQSYSSPEYSNCLN